MPSRLNWPIDLFCNSKREFDEKFDEKILKRQNKLKFRFTVWKQIRTFATMKQEKFKIILLEDARNFVKSLSDKANYKVYYNMKRIANGERDKEIFKKLENTDIWEFRTLYDKIAYRLFAFWDAEEYALIVVTLGIVKKPQKTPQKEIAKAESLMKRYFELKHKK